MSLEHFETEEYYHVVQRINSFFHTDVMRVRCTKDLSRSQVNHEPWHSMTSSTRHWFEKHHLEKCKENKR